ncbi:MAG: hypothetical protein HC836_34640 [Richelia sp. RM2_1_2]|nr:hypothetical protein [Richelia sp. RM2_1_2]
MYNREYFITVEDKGLTHNINMHSFFCFALSIDEAMGKMYRERPEFIGRKVTSVRYIVHGITVYESEIVVNIKSKTKLILIDPNPETGLYKSLQMLRDCTADFTLFIEKKLVELNPTRYKYLS